jgi:hypothetical protein
MSDAVGVQACSPFDPATLASWQRQELSAIPRPLGELIPLLRLASNERAIERSKRGIAQLEEVFLRESKPGTLQLPKADREKDEEYECLLEDRRRTSWQDLAQQAIVEITALHRPEYDSLAHHIRHVSEKFPYVHCRPFKARAYEYISGETEALRALSSLFEAIANEPTPAAVILAVHQPEAGAGSEHSSLRQASDDTAVSDAWLACSDIAKTFKVPLKALEKRLQRFRPLHDSDWKEIESSSRSRRSPKYMYRVAAIRPIIDEMRAKQAALDRRPASIDRLAKKISTQKSP